MQKITVFLADDHVLVRDGIKAMLEADEEILVVGEADNGVKAIEKIAELKPDLSIMDIRMPQMDGLEACALLTKNNVDTKVVILSMHDNAEYVLQSLSAGAWGYLLKDTDKNEFLKALKQIYTGARYFSGAVSNVLAKQLLESAKTTPSLQKEHLASSDPQDAYGLSKREKEILGMVVNGKHNKEIAEVLVKSVRTIETHRFNIMKKLGVNNAVEMINKVMREHII